MKIQAAVARGKPAMDLETCELDKPGLGEVRVKVEACGICHTDLFAMSGALGTPLPAVLGHEGVGRIEMLGEGVTDFSVGDRVLMSFGACGRCSSCQQKQTAYCHQALNLNLLGRRMDNSSPVTQMIGDFLSGHFFAQSSFATHAIARTATMVALDDDLPSEFMAPLACGVQTGASSVVNVLKAQPGRKIAVFGCGAVGLAAVMAAKIQGCSTIIAVDLNPQRVEMAKEVGATHGVTGGYEAIAAVVKSVGGVHYGFDSTGNPDVIALGFSLLLSQGKMVCAGISPPDAMLKINPRDLIFGGRTLVGTIEGNSNPRDFVPEMIHWFREGQLPVDKLVKTYPFVEINQAIHDFSTGKTIKPVLIM